MTDALEGLRDLLARHERDLSALAAVLGVSSRSVEARLAELHASLVETVKEQRRKAESEVTLVRDELAAVRAAILAKRTALGDATDEPAREGEVRGARADDSLMV